MACHVSRNVAKRSCTHRPTDITAPIFRLFLRQLCANCTCFVGKPDFWLYFHTLPETPPGDDTHFGELMLFTILANTPADTVVQWMDEEFSHDDFYIRRLSPFYVAPPEGHA